MSGDCIPVEELERVASLPAGDPGRAHLDACTRCRSLADMLREFARPSVPAPDAGFPAVDEHLVATISDLTGIAAGSEAAVAPAASARVFVPDPESAPRRSWWASFGGMRLAGAVAVVVVVGAGLGLWSARREPPLMRAAGTHAAAFGAVAVHAVASGVELTWEAVPRATGYQVVILDGSLAEVKRLPVTAATSFRVEASALPAALVHGGALGCEVEALAGHDRIAVSPAVGITLP